jgi:hypothetical protein
LADAARLTLTANLSRAGLRAPRPTGHELVATAERNADELPPWYVSWTLEG